MNYKKKSFHSNTHKTLYIYPSITIRGFDVSFVLGI